MKLFIGLTLGIVVVLIVLFGVDREMARQEWLEVGQCTDCIFELNCDYYNNK